MKTETILWLFPVFFMLHEFEEIIFLPGWLGRNIDEVAKKYTRLPKSLRSHAGTMSSAGFALAVAEEFVIVSALTLISVEYALYSLFAALLLVYLLHGIIHCIQALLIRRYVPAVATGIISGCYVLFALQHLDSSSIVDWSSVMKTAPVLFIVMILNLLIMHRVMEHFEKWNAGKKIAG